MDKFILSQLVKELLLEKGQAVLPGFGVLSTRPSSASFSENGRIINPPTKKIVFTENASIEDSLLVERYASRLNEPVESLKKPSESFIRELASEAVSGGSVELPGLGTISFSDTEGFSFVADHGKDIFAERDGLEPIQLRIIEREEPEAVIPEATEEEAPSIIIEPEGHEEPEQGPETETEPSPPPASSITLNPDDSKHDEKINNELEPADRRHRWFIIIVILLGIIIIAAILYILGCNGMLDSLLYSEDELKLMESLK